MKLAAALFEGVDDGAEVVLDHPFVRAKVVTVFHSAALAHSVGEKLAANLAANLRYLRGRRSLTQEKLVALLERALVEESRQSISLLGYSRDHQSEREVSASWEALDAWKEHRLYK